MISSQTISNLFSFFYTVQGHEEDRFALFDLSGRLVGTYYGDCIGEDLPPGAYILKELGKDPLTVHIVKLSKDVFESLTNIKAKITL